MGGDTPPLVVGFSRIPTPGSSSPGNRQGKSNIPSPARNSAQPDAGRKGKSILESLLPAASPLQQSADVHVAAHDQSDKFAKQRKIVSSAVPSLNLSRLQRGLQGAEGTVAVGLGPRLTEPGTATETTEPVASSLASPTASHTPVPKNRKVQPRQEDAAAAINMDAGHTPSEAAKRKLSRSVGTASKVVFGRAMISPRGHKQGKMTQSPTLSFGQHADRSNRCSSAMKSREPAIQEPQQSTRSISVDKSRLSLSRSISVEKSSQRPGKAAGAGAGAGDSKFRQTAPSLARRQPAEAIAGASNPSKQASLLTAILEVKPQAFSSLKPSAPATANVNPRPKPTFSLNLASVKQQSSLAEESSTEGLSGSSSMASQVPKLNLTPVLQQREEEHGMHASYKVASATNKPSGGQSKLDEPVDHFYLYPKLDPKEERANIDMISRYHLPNEPANHMKKLFGTMIQAKQNCEAMAFRGHRLLDQLNSHLKEKIEEGRKEKEEVIQQFSRTIEEERKEKAEVIQQFSRTVKEFEKKSDEQQKEIEMMKRVFRELQMAGVLEAGAYEQGIQNANSSASHEPVSESGMSEADALQDLKAMSAQIRRGASFVQDSVRQLSSRLGGVAVLTKAKAGNYGAVKQRTDSRLEQSASESTGQDSLKGLKVCSNDQGVAKQPRSAVDVQPGDDDLQAVQDIDGAKC